MVVSDASIVSAKAMIMSVRIGRCFWIVAEPLFVEKLNLVVQLSEIARVAFKCGDNINARFQSAVLVGSVPVDRSLREARVGDPEVH